MSDLGQAGQFGNDRDYTDELSSVTLRNPRAEVLELYSTMTAENYHDIYHAVSADMRSDLWTVHLARALTEIPSLSTEQRVVILQGIGLIATGALEIDHYDPSWLWRVHEPIQALDNQAKRVFKRSVGCAIFTQLYATVSMVQGHFQPPTNGCSCSTESDWCSITPTDVGECRSGHMICLPQQGCCGTFLQYDCDGDCA